MARELSKQIAAAYRDDGTECEHSTGRCKRYAVSFLQAWCCSTSPHVTRKMAAGWQVMQDNTADPSDCRLKKCRMLQGCNLGNFPGT